MASFLHVTDKVRKSNWSGKRGSNPQLQPWEGCTLPLSYSRSTSGLYNGREKQEKARLGFTRDGFWQLSVSANAQLTPTLVTGMAMLDAIPEKEIVIDPR
jgi:hypothetical protein